MNTSNNAFQMIADFEGDLAQLLQNDKHDNPIPLLVTRNFVLFPGVIAPILIGREPSLNLIHKLDEGEDKTFALFSQKNDKVDDPNIEDVYHTGVYAKLVKVLEIPGSIEQAVITRFKVLARMNIAEHRRPQDGTFSIKYNDRMYDFRINTLPVSGKEKVVIRILAPAVSLKAAGDKMIIPGASDADIEKIHDMVQSPNGIILTSGPTGSVKLQLCTQY